MYWINGFIIDQMQQGKGYGKSGITRKYILNKKIHLRCVRS